MLRGYLVNNWLYKCKNYDLHVKKDMIYAITITV